MNWWLLVSLWKKVQPTFVLKGLRDRYSLNKYVLTEIYCDMDDGMFVTSKILKGTNRNRKMIQSHFFYIL